MSRLHLKTASKTQRKLLLINCLQAEEESSFFVNPYSKDCIEYCIESTLWTKHARNTCLYSICIEKK